MSANVSFSWNFGIAKKDNRSTRRQRRVDLEIFYLI